jgi:Flp pilus assembly protein CpaB
VCARRAERRQPDDFEEGKENNAMKKNMVPLLGIAFVVAIISTGVFYGLFAGKLRSSTEVPGHPIVVAARDLDRGTVLQPGDLRLAELEGVISGSFSKTDDATGATLLTAVRANEPLLEERVSPRPTDAERAGGLVPKGMRAMTVHVTQSESLLGLLRPGSRVDLQAVTDKNGGELRTVLENVQVLAAGQTDGNHPANLTVLIRAQDADIVALADAASRVRVALRNSADKDSSRHHALTWQALFSNGSQEE